MPDVAYNLTLKQILEFSTICILGATHPDLHNSTQPKNNKNNKSSKACGHKFTCLTFCHDYEFLY